MAEAMPQVTSASSIAIVGLACRFPDADDPAALLDAVLTGRRAFRRLPPSRLEPGGPAAAASPAELAAAGLATSARAALIEGWHFDRTAFRIPPPAYAADPAYLLTLETAAKALAAAGFPGGKGLDRDRIGVIIGNAPVSGYLVTGVPPGGSLAHGGPLSADPLSASPLSADPLSASPLSADPLSASPLSASPLSASAADGTMDDSPHRPITARISSYFGFRGGGHCVDGGAASALQAVSSACAALMGGDLDVALAGGVDVSLCQAAGGHGTGGLGTGGLGAGGLGHAGLGLADGRGCVRIYDESPTGCLPGEGCGVVVLMRTADARAAGLPVYAEIIGSGSSAGAASGSITSDAGSQLLALSRAYERAGIDPADIRLIEGSGSATAAADEAELTALGLLRRHARRPAALGSVTANMGHANAAAGASGLIKVVLALGTGIVPPTTGVRRPHPLLRSGEANLELPATATDWPAGHRLAGVSAMGSGGINVHLVLRNEPGCRSRPDRVLRVLPRPGRADAAVPRPTVTCQVSDGTEGPAAYLLHAQDRRQLAGLLARVAELAGWLSDAEMQDLACQLARDAVHQGPARAAVVAARQDELARQARTASGLLPGLSDGVLAARPGVFAADGADGRVTLLLSDGTTGTPGSSQRQGKPGAGPDGGLAQWSATLSRTLDTLRWLESLDVRASTAVGHGFGEIVGLLWAGVLDEAAATELATLRSELLRGPAWPPAGPGKHAGRQQGRRGIAALPRDERALLRAATAHLRFGPPRRRLISASTGTELSGPTQLTETKITKVQLTEAQLTEAQLTEAQLTAPQIAGTQVAGPATHWPGPSSAEQVIDLICAGLGGAPRLADALAIGAIGATMMLEAGPPGLLAAATAGRSRVPAISAGSGQHGEGTADAAAALFAAGALRQPLALYPGQPARPIDIWRERIFLTGALPVSPDKPGSATSRQLGGGRESGPRPAAAAPATAGLVLGGSVLGGSAPGGSAPGSVAGARPWVRCYGEQLRDPTRSARHTDDGPWQIRVGASNPFGLEVSELFRADAGARRTLAIVAGPAEPGGCAAAVSAARDAIRTGRLVVITASAALDGFWATLHAEHPALGITVLRAPASPAGLRAAARFADAEPGEFRQLIIDSAGRPHEPVMCPAWTGGGGTFPLGVGDVAMITRQAGGAGLALAQVLALCGAAVAIIGREPLDTDAPVVAGLERLRSAGASVGYEVVDIGDPAALADAVQRIESRLGPVTALGHAVGTLPALAVSELTETVLRGHLADQAAVLRQLLSSVRAGRLRLIATFGSVAASYGLVGEGVLAVASAAMAEQAERAAAGIPGCRSLHVDWPGWPGSGTGQRPGMADSLAAAGVEPVSVRAGSRQLLRLLGTPELPGRLAVHGRVGIPAPCLIGAASTAMPAGRFIEQVLVHYPGVELVCQARLSLSSDPYLADYRVDGMPVLPPVMALEALAQAASVLAGRPVRQAAQVSMDAPVVLPDGSGYSQALIRLCALRDGDTVTAVLRCEDSGFAVEHARAQFRIDAGAAAAGPAAGTPLVTALSPGQSGLVDGTELYGPVCFQAGRFRRVAILPEVTSRSCRALARGGDDQPWFGAAGSCTEAGSRAETGSGAQTGSGAEAGSGLVLGSPGLNDATLHLLQACLPHRRLGLAGCEAVTFSGRIAEGAVEIRATAVPPDPQEGQGEPAVPPPAGPAVIAAALADLASDNVTGEVSGGAARPMAVIPVQRPAAGPPPGTAPGWLADPRWDIEAVDASGQCLVRWRGVRLRDGGPLPRNAAWPPSLLSVYLEQGARALGLDGGLTVRIQCGQPDLGRLGSAARTGADVRPAAIRLPSQRASADAVPGQAAAAAAEAAAARHTATVAGLGQLSGCTLTVASATAVACGWTVTETAHRVPAVAASGLSAAHAQLRQLATESPSLAAARLQAIASCLAAAGAPASCVVRVERATGDGWVLLEAGGARIASVVIELSGVSGPVAMAMLTGTPRAEQARPGRGRRRSRGRGLRAAVRP